MRTKIFFLIVLFFIQFSLIIYAQKVTEGHRKDFNDLILLLDDYAYHDAVPLCKGLLEIDTESAHLNYLTGYSIYHENINRKDAIAFFEKAIKSVDIRYNRNVLNEKNEVNTTIF